MEALKRLDALVESCVSGELAIDQFFEEYGYPVGGYALDGHEANEKEKKRLEELSGRLDIHLEIADCILNRLCTAEQAEDDDYQKSGRIGPKEAQVLLVEIFERHRLRSAT